MEKLSVADPSEMEKQDEIEFRRALTITPLGDALSVSLACGWRLLADFCESVELVCRLYGVTGDFFGSGELRSNENFVPESVDSRRLKRLRLLRKLLLNEPFLAIFCSSLVISTPSSSSSSESISMPNFVVLMTFGGWSRASFCVSPFVRLGSSYLGKPL